MNFGRPKRKTLERNKTKYATDDFLSFGLKLEKDSVKHLIKSDSI
jgi:hypothetical protein